MNWQWDEKEKCYLCACSHCDRKEYGKLAIFKICGCRFKDKPKPVKQSGEG
jgi:hypothetical protein